MLLQGAFEDGVVEVSGGITNAGVGLAVVGALGADHVIIFIKPNN